MEGESGEVERNLESVVSRCRVMAASIIEVLDGGTNQEGEEECRKAPVTTEDHLDMLQGDLERHYAQLLVARDRIRDKIIRRIW